MKKNYTSPMLVVFNALEEEFCQKQSDEELSIAETLNYKTLNRQLIDLDLLEDWVDEE